jgi:predicted dehydrogenase
MRFAQVGVLNPHAQGYRETLRLMPEARLVAAHDADQAAATATLHAEGLRIPVYDGLADLLARARPDAVIMTLPPAETPAAIIAAANAGCHVYAEKPCARMAAEFLPAKAAIEAAGVQFWTGYQRRFMPVGIAIREIVAQGLLGELVSAEARFISTSVGSRDPSHWLFSRERSGGGILSWLGCHWLDFLRWSTGTEVRDVAAQMETRSGEPIDVEDTVALALRYTNGLLATLNCAYVTDRPHNDTYFALRGRLGWLSWDQSGPVLDVTSDHPAWATAPARTLRFDPDETGGYGGAAGIAALRAFIAAIAGTGPPIFTPDDTLRVLEVIEAAQVSAGTGLRVAVDRATTEHPAPR